MRLGCWVDGACSWVNYVWHSQWVVNGKLVVVVLAISDLWHSRKKREERDRRERRERKARGGVIERGICVNSHEN